MKDLVYNFLIWVSGSDENILDDCIQLEQKKHALYGALILIPSTMALISGTYAISTFNDNFLVFMPLGIIWSIIVLFIDRFLVSTFRKSGSAIKDLKSSYFIIRAFLAIAFGIVVSHPMVLFVFDGVITNELSEMKIERFESTENKFQEKFQERETYLQGRIENFDSLLIAERQALACFQTLVSNEQSGKEIQLDCGGTSGILGPYGLTKNLQKIVRDKEKNIKNLKVSRTKADSLFKSEKQQLEDNVKKENDQVEKAFNRDYFNRDLALDRLSSRYDVISHSKWFLLLFFIFLDLIPVLMKVMTKKGHYDLMVDHFELEIPDNSYTETRSVRSYFKAGWLRVVKEYEEKIYDLYKRKFDDAYSEYVEGKNHDLNVFFNKIGQVFQEFKKGLYSFNNQSSQYDNKEQDENSFKNNNRKIKIIKIVLILGFTILSFILSLLFEVEKYVSEVTLGVPAVVFALLTLVAQIDSSKA